MSLNDSIELSCLKLRKFEAENYNETETEFKKIFPVQTFSWSNGTLTAGNWCNNISSNMNNSCGSPLLLQNSDDPLIGHGANNVNDDYHPFELTKLQQQQQQATDATKNWSAIVRENLKYKANLMNQQAKVAKIQMEMKKKIDLQDSTEQTKQQQQQLIQDKSLETKRKKNFKLRFHHQALPAEYLNHQQQQQQQQQQKQDHYIKKSDRNNNQKKEKNINRRNKDNNKNQQTQFKATTKSEHGNVRTWLKSIIELQKYVTKQNSGQEKPKEETGNQLEGLETTCNTAREEKIIKPENKVEIKHSIYFNDLPYMGEITLDNSRPRRGRKPKKANICHLIYKNYGTIILGEPKTAFDNYNCNKDCICEPDIESNYNQEPMNIEQMPLNLCLRDQLKMPTETVRVEEVQKMALVQEMKPEPEISQINEHNFLDIIANKKKQQQQQQQEQQKSTIYITPKSISPNRGVSIGKFKFTGGVNLYLPENQIRKFDDDNNPSILHLNGINENAHASTSSNVNLRRDRKSIVAHECLHSTHKHKLSPRSEQRERLEKTFKEQGFLIQTQQMQSAEGATYCKFRQLKKFTRYLFRNWKDYLPNELQYQQQQQPQDTQRGQNQPTPLMCTPNISDV